MARMIKPAFPYYGGKTTLAKWIIHLLPRPEKNQHYIEIFGGLASVLLARPRVNLETLIDDSAEVTHWHLCCQKHGKSLAKRIIDDMPVRSIEAMQQRKQWLDQNPPPAWPETDLERAAAWAFIRMLSRHGQETSTGTGSLGVRWDALRLRTHRDPSAVAQRIRAIAWRLSGVQILHRDGLDVLEHQRSNHLAVIYCDPPYAGFENHYDAKYDRKRMLQLLTAPGLNAQVAVSGYQNDWPELEAADWQRHDRNITRHSAASTSSKRVCESLWTSYKTPCP